MGVQDLVFPAAFKEVTFDWVKLLAGAPCPRDLELPCWSLEVSISAGSIVQQNTVNLLLCSRNIVA